MCLSPKTLLVAVNAVCNHAGDGGGAGVRRRLALAIGLAVVVGTFVIEIPIGQSSVYYVDVKNPSCSDAPGFGSQSKPYCSLNYAATIASPGDTFLIQSGRYSQGTTVFRRSGTATAPITWRAVGDVTFGLDVRDEDFRPVSGMANVYSIPWTNPLPPSHMSQMRFAPILVDDPNQSKFTMVQEDGPVRLSRVTSDALLVAHEGTWRLNGGQLFVRAYGDRVPSTAATDFVVGVSAGDKPDY